MFPFGMWSPPPQEEDPYTDCDHCGKKLYIKGFTEGSVAWCRECVDSDKELLYGVGINTSKASATALWWNDSSKVEIVRGIGKLGSTPKQSSVACKREYYGIECGCSQKCASFSSNETRDVFGYGKRY